jgi:uncharacterized protein YukE
MKRTLVLGSAIGLFLVVGCGRTNPGDALMKERIAAINELSDVLGSLNDPASAKDMDAKVKKIKDHLADIDKRWAQLSKADQEAAANKYGFELAQAETSLALKQGKAVMGGLQDFSKGFGDLGNQVHKDFQDAQKDLNKDINELRKDLNKDVAKDFGKDFPKP